MTTYAMTVSTQVKSANTETDIKFHSGKENRETYAHENKNIDLERSHLNVEFDFHSREELLEAHYGDWVRKHDMQNNSAKRRYGSVEGYLATFEGNEVLGKEKNVRWATVSQMTYVGDKETIGELWEDLSEAGATDEMLIQAYSEGYREYVEKHNETFPMLPIYHSDIHFDESTPHGHDAIVVMAVTDKTPKGKDGKPTDSFNTALGMKYGYKLHNKEKMRLYREENDKLAFDSILGALQKVGEAKGMPFDTEIVRTGQTFSLDLNNYKIVKDEVRDAVGEREDELNDLEMKLSGREAELEERISGIDDKAAALAQREADVTGREARAKEKQDELDEQDKAMAEREAAVAAREAAVALSEDAKKKELSAKYWKGFRYGAKTVLAMSAHPDMATTKSLREQVTPNLAVKFTATDKDAHIVTRVREAGERVKRAQAKTTTQEQTKNNDGPQR